MILKRVTELNAVLSDWDESFLPNGKKKVFSIAFITKTGQFRFIKRAIKAGLKINMKANDFKALQPVDDNNNEIDHVYPVWIHSILFYSGTIEYNLLK